MGLIGFDLVGLVWFIQDRAGVDQIISAWLIIDCIWFAYIGLVLMRLDSIG